MRRGFPNSRIAGLFAVLAAVHAVAWERGLPAREVKDAASRRATPGSAGFQPANTARPQANRIPLDFGAARAEAGGIVRTLPQEADAPDPPGLLVATDGSRDWSGAEVPFAGGPADLSGAGLLRVTVSNACDETFRVHATLVTGAWQGRNPSYHATLRPHETREIPLRLWSAPWALSAPLDLPGMKHAPKAAGDGAFDLSACRGVLVTRALRQSTAPASFAVLGATVEGTPVAPRVLDAATFLPFVDRYGQFRHDDWPLKIHSDAELAAAWAREEAQLAALPESPIPGADRFGGHGDGPQLAATGRFRTEKVGGKWWLVDPDGHLFFSHGVDCVYASTPTPIIGRERFFEWLPGPGDPEARCGWFGPDGAMTHVDFAQVNLVRRFGADWKPRFADLAARRLRAWGFNTIANWSPDYAREPRLIPYTMQFNTGAFPHRLALADGSACKEFPDVFHPDFPAFLREKAAAVAAWAGDDPMLLGVFVDNELRWDRAQKAADFPGVAERYFAEVEAALRETLPGALYLGCRFAWESASREEWRAAARHCDVVSVNIYERTPARDLPPDAEDKPMLVGEFHFGAFDAGMFAPGLAPALDQKERGECYRAFVRDCLDGPRWVGAHWFQYQDQALTGRPDGENYQCGLVTVCDVPYPEMVRAARDIAGEMYRRPMPKPHVHFPPEPARVR